MLDITYEDNKFYLYLDNQSPHYTKCRIIVEGLLSSLKKGKDKYTCSFNDLTILKNKLDLMGLIGGRTMTIEAQNKINSRHYFVERNERIKNGEFNEDIKGIINGKLKSELYKDQLTAVSFLYYNQKSGNWDEMGMGKTLCSLATIVALGEEVKKTLVICPKNVTIGFEREIYKHTYLKPAVIPSGRKKALETVKEKKNDNDWDVMIIHPENLIQPKTENNSSVTGKGKIVELLCSMPWDMIIIDEFHMYKEEGNKRTKCVLDIVKKSKNRTGNWPRVIAMTGTPVSESPLNAYMVLKVLGYDFIPHISVFKEHFCIQKMKKVQKDTIVNGVKIPGRKVKVIDGYKNLQELKFLMDRISIRRTKDEMQGFPDKIVSIRDVFLTGKQLAMYKLICGEIINEISQHRMINIFKYLDKSTSVLRLRQLMNHPNLLEESGESAKYLELDSIIEEVLSDKKQKIIMFMNYRTN